MNETDTVKFATVAAPGNAATIVLWSSCDPSAGVRGAFGPRRMRHLRMTMLQLLFIRHATNASAVGGLIPYCSTDGGTNWRAMDFKDSAGAATMPAQVAALAAGANKRYAFEITDIDDFKVEYTAGATAPTTWELEITGIFGGASVQK